MVCAVYVRSVQKQQQFYTERGKWRIGFSKDLEYVIKGFTSPEFVEPLIPYFPNAVAELSTEMQSNIEGGVPRELGADILWMLRSFNDQLLDFYRANAPKLDNMYEVVADNDESVSYTIEELASKILGMDKSELDDVMLLAVHKAAMRYAFLVQNDRSSLFSDHYLVQPKRVAKVLETVTTWVHEHKDMLVRAAMKDDAPELKNHPLDTFVRKARRLVNLSRKFRSPTKMGNVGPTSYRFEPGQDDNLQVLRETTTEKFNANDRMIIEYLLLWCIPPKKMTSGTLRACGSHIMRNTGLYTGLEASAASAPLFLQEVGVLAPWDNLRLLDLGLRLPGHGVSRESDRMWEAVQTEADRLASEGMVDSMRHMRTHWGDQPIYCVDDPTAHEIDDGISLERVPGSDDEFWVRVHVANPSSFIPHDNLIMEYAAERNQTLYAPERIYPMLPDSLTHQHFSLAPGRPTLTFSAKMNREGEVLDTDVRNGTAGKVVNITHSKIRSLFQPEPESSTLTVGGTYAPPPGRANITETLSATDEETFRTLRDLMLGFRKFRLQNGAMEFPSSPSTSVSVTAGRNPLEPHNMRQRHTSRYILGDPIIQARLLPTNPHEVPDLTKTNLVATLMNLACWVSGRWCAARNIPAIYDGTFYHPEYSPLTNRNVDRYGGASWLDLAPPKGVSSSMPLHHMPLGLDAYIKSTSPLRRYSDLLVHYQIEAALRFEADTKPEPGSEPDYTTTDTTTSTEPQTQILPFTSPGIETYLNRTRWLRARIRDVSSTAAQHWACQLLFRAFYFAESPLPETFPVLLQKPYTQTSLAGTQFGQGFAGTLVGLGVRCQVVFADVEGEGKSGTGSEALDVGRGILSIVEARIVAVDLSRMLVVMEGVRVVRGFKRVGEWQ